MAVRSLTSPLTSYCFVLQPLVLVIHFPKPPALLLPVTFLAILPPLFCFCIRADYSSCLHSSLSHYISLSPNILHNIRWNSEVAYSSDRDGSEWHWSGGARGPPTKRSHGGAGDSTNQSMVITACHSWAWRQSVTCTAVLQLRTCKNRSVEGRFGIANIDYHWLIIADIVRTMRLGRSIYAWNFGKLQFGSQYKYRSRDTANYLWRQVKCVHIVVFMKLSHTSKP